MITLGTCTEHGYAWRAGGCCPKCPPLGPPRPPRTDPFEALRRLGSMEAFGVARLMDPKRDDRELLARIDYARSVLAEHGLPQW